MYISLRFINDNLVSLDEETRVYHYVVFTFQIQNSCLFQLASNDGDEGDVQPGSRHLLTPESKAAVESGPKRVAGSRRSSLGKYVLEMHIFSRNLHFTPLLTA